MSDSPEEPAAEPAAEPSAEDLAELGDRDALFEALWKRCLEAWDDDKPHQAILQHALKSEKLPDLAGRYRALKDDPEKKARAEKKLDGIVAAAMQMMMMTKTPAVTKTPWQWTASVAVVCVVVIAWLAWKVLFRHH